MSRHFTRHRCTAALALVGVMTLGAPVTPPTTGQSPDTTSASASASATLRDQAGTSVGAVHFQQLEGAVLVSAAARSLPAGFHGFHVHAVGQCVVPFTSAGGHHNPAGGGHGDHAGDMPSLLATGDGGAVLQFFTDRFTVDELFDADGSAVIVHAARDNYANIPTRYHSHTEDVFGPDSATLATGDAGPRSACGIVRR